MEISQNFVAFLEYMNFTLFETCVLQIFICEKLAKFTPFAFIKVPLYLTSFLTFIEKKTYFKNVYLWKLSITKAIIGFEFNSGPPFKI